MATTPAPAATTIPMEALTFLRDAIIAEVPRLKTCKVGLEADMQPGDYPMARIVPTKLGRAEAVRVSELVRQIDCLIYFGVPVNEFEDGAEEDGLENLYAEIFELERDLIRALPRTGPYLVRYIETTTDEDRIAAYKLMCMRVAVGGLV